MSNCIYDSDKCRLNPEPTDVQRAQWRRHHKKGTSPGNPKWYRAPNPTPKAPFTWRPGMAPVYPKLSPAESDYRKPAPDPFEAARGKETTAEYVAAYDKAAGLKSA